MKENVICLVLSNIVMYICRMNVWHDLEHVLNRKLSEKE